MRCIAIFLSVLISGCAVNTKYSELTELQKEQYSKIRLYAGGLKTDYSEIGLVEGKVCHRNAHAKYIDKSKVMEALRVSAAEAAVDAVINVSCKVDRKADFIHNCWAKGVCSGIGITFD